MRRRPSAWTKRNRADEAYVAAEDAQAAADDAQTSADEALSTAQAACSELLLNTDSIGC